LQRRQRKAGLRARERKSLKTVRRYKQARMGRKSLEEQVPDVALCKWAFPGLLSSHFGSSDRYWGIVTHSHIDLRQFSERGRPRTGTERGRPTEWACRGGECWVRHAWLRILINAVYSSWPGTQDMILAAVAISVESGSRSDHRGKQWEASSRLISGSKASGGILYFSYRRYMAMRTCGLDLLICHCPEGPVRGRILGQH
jgi:hypothetical protein